MDITEALADVLRSEKAIRRVTFPTLAAAAGISRASAIRKLAGEREIRMVELRGFAAALGVRASDVMAAAEGRLDASTSTGRALSGEDPQLSAAVEARIAAIGEGLEPDQVEAPGVTRSRPPRTGRGA